MGTASPKPNKGGEPGAEQCRAILGASFRRSRAQVQRHIKEIV